MSLSAGKIQHMKALSNSAGVIACAAMDQRGSLAKSLATAKGVSQKEISDQMMQEFKTAVTRVLTPYATGILLDPEWGLPAVQSARQERRPASRLRSTAATTIPSPAACPISCHTVSVPAASRKKWAPTRSRF